MPADTGARDASPRDDAIRLLSRREYSRQELVERLAVKGHEPVAIHDCLDDLAERGLQSDARFAESFVRSCIQRGQGPMKIRIELERRGIDREQVSAIFADCDPSGEPDWCSLACEALARRYSSPGGTPRERARRERFLAGRGFDFEQVRYAMEHAWSE